MDNTRLILAREPVARELLSIHKPEVEDSPPFLPSHLLSALLGTPLTGPFLCSSDEPWAQRVQFQVVPRQNVDETLPLENVLPPWVRIVRMAGTPGLALGFNDRPTAPFST